MSLFVATLELNDTRLGKALSEHVLKRLEQTGRYHIPGFGVFRVVRRRARSIRNPQTKEIIEIPAGNTIQFHAALDLRRSSASMKIYEKAKS